MPVLLAIEARDKIEYIGIVDAYCDEDKDEYVDAVNGK